MSGTPKMQDGQQPLTQDALSQIPKKISLHSQLPSFKDVPANQKTILFISKLRQCNKLVRIDDQDLRKMKHLVLYQLLEQVNSQNNVFPLDAIPDFFNTVSLNIFRQSPKPQAEDVDVYDPEEDEPQVDANWYHLQFVYEMLLRFVYSASSQNPDYQRAVKKHIDCDFLIRLMQLFNQSDPRERDYVKTILHRIYANVMSLRAFIRQTLRSELQIYFSFTQQHSGICDILEVLGSIVNGYATPLKPEHTSFLTQCLLPMHKVQRIKMILPQLSYCISKFIEKEPSLSGLVMQSILQFYPKTNSHKEVLILTEIEELLELMPPEAILVTKNTVLNASQTEKQTDKLSETPLRIYSRLFDTVSQAMCSLHFQVAEKAVNLIGNQKFLAHVQFAQQKYVEELGKSPFRNEAVEPEEWLRINPMHVLAKALRSNEAHWNSTIRFLSDQNFKQLQNVNSKETFGIEQKMLVQEVTREYRREARETLKAVITQQALENAAKFGSYFNKQPKTQENTQGYQIEVIQNDQVLEAIVPEDPLYCRVPEMCLKQLQITPEELCSQLEDNLKKCDTTATNPAITLKGDLTEMDKLAMKGVDICSKTVSKKIIETTVQQLQKTDQIKPEEVEATSNKLFTVQTKLPTKRMANRRASAGVQLTMGVRRKSVVPMSSVQKQAQKELENFEKHKITQ